MKYLILFLLSAFVINAMASDENVLVIRPDRNSILEDSSAHRRMGKNYELTAQTFGIGPMLASGQGLTAGIFLNHNQLIQLEVMGGEIPSPGLDMSKIQSRSAGVHFKHFLGNSFYYRAGVDYLSVNYDKTVYSRTTSYANGQSTVIDEGWGKFDGSMTGATFVIGNQWQWQNFTLGCDWVGATAPLFSSVQAQSTLDDYSQRELKRDEDAFLKNTKIHLARFYLGASF